MIESNPKTTPSVQKLIHMMSTGILLSEIRGRFKEECHGRGQGTSEISQTLFAGTFVAVGRLRSRALSYSTPWHTKGGFAGITTETDPRIRMGQVIGSRPREEGYGDPTEPRRREFGSALCPKIDAPNPRFLAESARKSPRASRV